MQKILNKKVLAIITCLAVLAGFCGCEKLNIDDSKSALEEGTLIEDLEEYVYDVDDMASIVRTVELTPDNYYDYLSFRQIDTENELTGYEAEYRKKYKPYVYMINTYVGDGVILTDLSSKISCAGTIDRTVTLKVLDLDYHLCNSSVVGESSGEDLPFAYSFNPSYIDNEDSYAIHFTPYQDPLESWLIKTFSNGLKEVHQILVEVSDIKLTEVSGTLVIFNKDNINWNQDDNGFYYIAIRKADETERIYSCNGYEEKLARFVLGIE